MPDGTILVLGENTFPWHRLEARADDFDAILGEVASVTSRTDKSALASLDASSVVVDYDTAVRYRRRWWLRRRPLCS